MPFYMITFGHQERFFPHRC